MDCSSLYFIRSLLFKCKTCEGKPYKVPPSPPLPSSRVKEAPALSYFGLDYVGHLFVKSTGEGELINSGFVCLPVVLRGQSTSRLYPI